LGIVRFDPGDGFCANFIARGGVDGYTAKRSIQFGSIDRVAHSDFDSGDGGVFLEGGYGLELNGWMKKEKNGYGRNALYAR
jgi:hypothetical protein